MYFKNYLKKNKISLSPSLVALCEEGLRRMNESVDVTHTPEHIERILTLYAQYKPKVKTKEFREDVFLTAVLWHDAWKAQFGSNGYLRAAYAQVMEGILSARLFRHEARKYTDDSDFINSVSYAIRKHSQIQFLPLQTPESKLLWDLDKLDKWEPKRFSEIKDEFFATKSKLGRKLFKIYMNMDSDKGIHNVWLRSEFNKRKNAYFEAVGM